jgi:hypothetical protein
VDKEVRRLRESELEHVSRTAICSVVQECLKQQRQYEERRRSGSLTTSWLLTPRVSMAGAAAPASTQGATSLAGPCLDTGYGDGAVGRLSPVQEVVEAA